MYNVQLWKYPIHRKGFWWCFCLLLISLPLASAELNKKDFTTEAAVLETSAGKIKIAFFEKEAPLHTANFKKLIKEKFYEKVKFHRVIPDFVIQAGDPNTKGDDRSQYGTGNYGPEIEPEIGKIHFRGAVGAARTADDVNPGRKSSGSQFYICLKPQPQLDDQYTIFGRVVEGLETAKKIAAYKRNDKDLPDKPPVIKKTYLESYFDQEKYDYYRRKEAEKGTSGK